jgi:hypothetical protein
MPPVLIDENFNHRILRGVRLRIAHLDLFENLVIFLP